MAARFEEAFGASALEVTFDMFPDGLYVSLVARGELRVEHNVWAAGMAGTLAEASVPVRVVVRSESEFEEDDGQ